MSRTNNVSDMVLMAEGDTLTSWSANFTLASSYGALTTASATVNTAAINLAIVAATGTTGRVLITPGISYTEASLVIPDGVVLIVFSTLGTITYLTKDQGTSLPVTKGGLVIKSQGNTGVMLRSLDYGVTGEPILQFVDATNGDIAAIASKFEEFVEITDPAAPSANKARLYAKDDGAGNTALAVRFPTGDVVNICEQGQKTNLFGSVAWDPGSIAKNDNEVKVVSVTGAALGDFVIASFSLDILNLTLSAHVTAANLVDVVLHNGSAGAVDLGAGTVNVLVIRNW
jgi:hypothetical protein